jgi:hypothetical protein
MKEARIRVLTNDPDYSDYQDPEYDWSLSVYGDVKEIIPTDIPEPKGKYCYCTNSSNEWNVQLEGARRRRTSARTTSNEEWDSSSALSLRSVGNEVLYTADQMIWRSDTLYSRRAITTRANTMTTIVHSIVHSND